MILLDTNVVSETLRRRPDATAIAWLDAQSEHTLYLCTPVLAELLYGVERLPAGPRKTALRAGLDRLENDLYRDRILVFDVAAAKEYARIAAARSAAGRTIGQMDTLIAAIAASHRITIATRNVAHFADLKVELVNPFDSAPRDR